MVLMAIVDADYKFIYIDVRECLMVVYSKTVAFTRHFKTTLLTSLNQLNYQDQGKEFHTYLWQMMLLPLAII